MQFYFALPFVSPENITKTYLLVWCQFSLLHVYDNYWRLHCLCISWRLKIARIWCSLTPWRLKLIYITHKGTVRTAQRTLPPKEGQIGGWGNNRCLWWGSL